jgi:hypothetical protein
VALERVGQRGGKLLRLIQALKPVKDKAEKPEALQAAKAKHTKQDGKHAQGNLGAELLGT